MNIYRGSIRIAAAAVAITAPNAAHAQSRCPNICSPQVVLRPGILRSHLLGGPRVTSLTTGVEHTVQPSTNLQLQLLVTATTAIPRTSLNLAVQWLPNASAASNPFTEYTASDEGTGIRSNTPSLALNASFDFVPAAQTSGWFSLSGYAGDLFSAAARPDDRSAYTHKLDLGVSANLNPFNGLPRTTWLHAVSAFALIDYVATGLPRAGDVVPKNVRRFDTNARPAALLGGLSLPLVPLKK